MVNGWRLGGCALLRVIIMVLCIVDLYHIMSLKVKFNLFLYNHFLTIYIILCISQKKKNLTHIHMHKYTKLMGSGQGYVRIYTSDNMS